MSTIAVRPREKGTAIVTLTFTDEDGAVVVPTSAAWQLMRLDGTVVNERSFANCAFIGTEVALSGDDLAMFGTTDNGKRVFAIQAVYNSDAGNNLPLNDEVTFKIQKLLSQVDETL